MQAVAQQAVEAKKPNDKMEAVAQQAVKAEKADDAHPPLPPPRCAPPGAEVAASKRRPASSLESPAGPEQMRQTKAKKHSWIIVDLP